MRCYRIAGLCLLMPALQSAYAGPHAGYHIVSIDVTDLGTLGGNYSLGYAINDAGHITGHSKDAAGRGRAFYYANGVMSPVPGTPSGNVDQVGRAINNEDVIVGVIQQGSPSNRAFYYTPGDTTFRYFKDTVVSGLV